MAPTQQGDLLLRRRLRRKHQHAQLDGGAGGGEAKVQREQLALQLAKRLAREVLEHRDACGAGRR